MVFENGEALKCTYYNARTLAMVKLAYDCVVDLGMGNWLAEIRTLLTATKVDPTGLRHLMIYFDEGPCYEFVCRSFRVEQRVVGALSTDDCWTRESLEP
jgi:hypothetical protein